MGTGEKNGCLCAVWTESPVYGSIFCTGDHTGLYRGGGDGAVRHTVPSGKMLCNAAHVPVLQHGAFYAGDRPGKGVVLARRHPTADLPGALPIQVPESRWKSGRLCVHSAAHRPALIGVDVRTIERYLSRDGEEY